MSLGLNKLESIELPIPKYIDENGQEQEYNLNVVNSKDKLYVFENTTNSIKTFFKKTICDYSPIKVVVNKDFFEWTPFGVGFCDELGNEKWLGRVGAVEAVIENENKVVYKNLINGIDDEFIINYGKLKHNTIVNSTPLYDNSLIGRQISFVVDGMMNFSTNISMYVNDMLQEDNFETQESIVFKNQDGKDVFSIPTPIAYEVDGVEQINCKYVVTKEDSVISLKILVPLSWLEDDNRVYPVAIDPTLVYLESGAMPINIQSSSWSPDGEYFAIGYNYQAKVYKFNKFTNQITEIPTPAGGYPTRSENVSFTPNGKFLITSSSSTGSNVGVYAFDQFTGGFTKLVSEASATYAAIGYFHKENRIVYSNRYAVVFQDFDYDTGTFLGNTVSNGTSYTTQKIQITNNDKIILRLESTGDRFRANWYTNGGMGTALSLPSGLTSAQITSFHLSPDNKYIAFTTNTANNICVCSFDPDSGFIGLPKYPKQFLDVSGVGISFSRGMQYIVAAQNIAWPPSGNALKFYKFDKSSGEILDTVDITVRQPSMVNGYPVSSIEFSNDGNHLIVTQQINNDKGLYLYKFFYEPENNVFFKDEITEDYYTDNKGNTLMLLDFGTILAGQTTQIKKVLIENRFDFAVKDITLLNNNNNSEFNVEISKTDNPFVPEQILNYGSQILNPKESVPFYIRIVSSDQSSTGGMFRFMVKVNAV